VAGDGAVLSGSGDTDTDTQLVSATDTQAASSDVVVDDDVQLQQLHHDAVR